MCTLNGFVEYPLTIEEHSRANVKLLWYLLAPQTQNIDDDLAGLESISLDEIDAAFALLEREKEVMEREPVDGNEVWRAKSMRVGAKSHTRKLGHVDQGLAPKFVDDEIMVVDHTSHDNGLWDVDVLMSSNGVS
ncbi:uncharacterized protein EDB91DRAFT_1251883 [Suillus paluster]|uniref:uncharacterized protein n=1 Tax=Suillus paluster TaxID=48578 RepID=UPI001B87456E|nr:uncharacterized protein EDB91DRAFT_1251883 [Suillus paluster]KAG1732250.1 hypothetical protein EDB91DRAFT_1251883 [Suillus paluster]